MVSEEAKPSFKWKKISPFKKENHQLKGKITQRSHHFRVLLSFHSWRCLEALGTMPSLEWGNVWDHWQGRFTEFVDSCSKWMFKLPGISEVDHRVSLWAWWGKKKKKDSKGSKGIKFRKFSDERVLLCFEECDYYALRNEAKLLVWMEFCLKKTKRKNNSLSVRGTPITWSPLPMCVTEKSTREGAQERCCFPRKPPVACFPWWDVEVSA